MLKFAFLTLKNIIILKKWKTIVTPRFLALCLDSFWSCFCIIFGQFWVVLLHYFWIVLDRVFALFLDSFGSCFCILFGQFWIVFLIYLLPGSTFDIVITKNSKCFLGFLQIFYLNKNKDDFFCILNKKFPALFEYKMNTFLMFLIFYNMRKEYVFILYIYQI